MNDLTHPNYHMKISNDCGWIEFGFTHELLMNLNSTFAKSMNLNLVFSKSMNLNLSLVFF